MLRRETIAAYSKSEEAKNPQKSTACEQNASQMVVIVTTGLPIKMRQVIKGMNFFRNVEKQGSCTSRSKVKTKIHAYIFGMLIQQALLQ
jgi:hypothetical protein